MKWFVVLALALFLSPAVYRADPPPAPAKQAGPSFNKEIKPILWTEHVVSDMLWRQQYGFLPPDASDPAALGELAALARHDAWWVRLYVAEIMRRHAALRQADLVDRLARDADAQVRQSAAGQRRAP